MALRNLLRSKPLPPWPTPRYIGRVFVVYLAAGIVGGALFLIGAAVSLLL